MKKYSKKSIDELGVMIRLQMLKKGLRVRDLTKLTGLGQSEISRMLGHENFRARQIELLKQL